MDEREENRQNNMISNLPLLFASGYPTSLEKITQHQLENFIPFMVQCSLGHINVEDNIECTEPEWWPEDISFSIPFTKPKKFTGNWMQKMKSIVRICYQFHKSVFLLRFCTDLASYEHASLRFINNYNSTTSLFDRRSNKLLVTFRNENMSYDQPQRIRKCLLQRKTKNSRQIEIEAEQMMVEPAPFDIYLCDNCDAELYSKEAILEHEKTCNVDDDDVILCDSPAPSEKSNKTNEAFLSFMQIFNLKPAAENKSLKIATEKSATTSAKKDENAFMIVEKNRRLPRRNRTVHSLTRCPTIPLSSPAGQLLLRTTKTVMSTEYLTERLDRVERFCHAPSLAKSVYRPKYFDKKVCASNPHCTFKKPQDYRIRAYAFPRRQFSQRYRAKNVQMLNSTLIRRCRPVSIRLKKMTEQELSVRKSSQHGKLNIKLTRDTSQSSSSWKITSPSTEIIVETIDLCSSEDEEFNNCYYESSAKRGCRDADKQYAAKAIAPSVYCVKPKVETDNKTIPIHNTQKHRSTIAGVSKVAASNTIKKRSLPSTVIMSDKKPKLHENAAATVSSTTATTNAANNKQTKPLHPSVYIFSNFTSTTNAANGLAAVSERIQNQENHSIASAELVKSSGNSSITLPTLEWCAVTSATNNNNNNNASSLVSDVNAAYATEQELSSSTNLSLIHHQSFGSPARIVSIDLTS